MTNRFRSHMILLIITFLFFPLVASAGNIDPENKYAWGENVGWINFEPLHGDGVTVTNMNALYYVTQSSYFVRRP